MPHVLQVRVDEFHDLRTSTLPAKLEELLPDMASVTVDDGILDAHEKVVDHEALLLLRGVVKGLLNDVTAKSIHTELDGMTADALGNVEDVRRRTVLHTALDEEVAKAVEHQVLALTDDDLDDGLLLFSTTGLDLLLEEQRCLLVVATDDFVHDHFPIGGNVFVEEATVVERLSRKYIIGLYHLTRL